MVLWNNHAGALWQRFTIYLRREVAVERLSYTAADYSSRPGSGRAPAAGSGRAQGVLGRRRARGLPVEVAPDQRSVLLWIV